MTTPGTTPGEACPCCLQAQEDIKAAVAEALADPLAMLERLAREFDGCAEANSRDFDGVWAMVEIGKRGKVYYAVNGRRYPREEAAAMLAAGELGQRFRFYTRVGGHQWDRAGYEAEVERLFEGGKK